MLAGQLVHYIARICSGNSVYKQLYGSYSLTLIVVAMYALRTIRRTVDWTNDATLHLSSLYVCPRSAKLNLQVNTLVSYVISVLRTIFHIGR